MITKPGKKTGVFKRGSGDSVIVLWRGQEIATYPSMAAFVESHMHGQLVLQQRQEDLLEQEYRDL